MESVTPFESWAILELMGHRKLAGFVREAEIASGKFLRIDSPMGDGTSTTQFYSSGSVYCITPTTEELCREWAHNNRPEPVHRYELKAPPAPPVDAVTDGVNRDIPEDDQDDQDEEKEVMF